MDARDVEGYERGLQRGLDLAGEGADFFAEGRVARAARWLAGAGLAPTRIGEFGCGTGNNLRFLARRFPAARLVGLDVSEPMLRRARAHLGPGVELLRVDEFDDEGGLDLVFVNGVFHHIPHDLHAAELARVRRWLAPGGTLALFDNNPFNPGARWVMRRIPFDRDAVMVDPFALVRLVAAAGFEHRETRFYFLFPRALRVLRPLEPALERLPLGAQYAIYASAR